MTLSTTQCRLASRAHDGQPCMGVVGSGDDNELHVGIRQSLVQMSIAANIASQFRDRLGACDRIAGDDSVQSQTG